MIAIFLDIVHDDVEKQDIEGDRAIRTYLMEERGVSRKVENEKGGGRGMPDGISQIPPDLTTLERLTLRVSVFQV